MCIRDRHCTHHRTKHALVGRLEVRVAILSTNKLAALWHISVRFSYAPPSGNNGDAEGCVLLRHVPEIVSISNHREPAVVGLTSFISLTQNKPRCVYKDSIFHQTDDTVGGWSLPKNRRRVSSVESAARTCLHCSPYSLVACTCRAEPLGTKDDKA